jgi:hypothetical protein
MSLADAFDLAWTTRDAGLLASLALARALPTVRDRHTIRARVRMALDPDGRPDGAARLWATDHAGRRNERLRGDDLEASILDPDTWRCLPENASYVRRLLALAAAHQVRVFWLIPPFHPDAHARRGRRGLDSAYTAFIRAIQAEFPGLVVVDGRRARYGEESYRDPIHLNERGALAFSADVAEVLARALSVRYEAPRWVEIPPDSGQALPPDELLAKSARRRSAPENASPR